MKLGIRLQPLKKGVIIHSLFLAILLPLFVLLVLLLLQQGIYDVLSYSRFLDLGYQARGSRRADENIVLVNIERLPVSRAQVAAGLEIVKECSPRAIGVDIVLDSAIDSMEDALLSKALQGTVPIIIASELDANTLVLPHPAFQHHNVSWGFSELMIGRDGVVRRFQTKRVVQGSLYPAFAVQIAAMAGYPVDVHFPPGKHFLINYAGDDGAFNTVRLVDILHRYEENGKKVPEGMRTILKSRIVVFGYFADDSTRYPVFADIHRTPLSPSLTRLAEGKMYGSIIHANILDTLVGGRRIFEISRFWSFGGSALLILMNLLGKNLLAQKPSQRWKGISLFVLLIEFIVLASLPFLLFFYHDIQVDLSVPLIALVLFPRAETWYYRFAQKLALPLRRRVLKRFPPFLVEANLRVYKASSLPDRLRSALHAARMLSPLTDFLLRVLSQDGGSKRLLTGVEPLLPKLRNSLQNLNQVLLRANPLIAIEERFHDVKAEFILTEDRARGEFALQRERPAPSFDFDKRSVGFALIDIHSGNEEILYESYFLELLSAASQLLTHLRGLFKMMKWEEVTAVPLVLRKEYQSAVSEARGPSEVHVTLAAWAGERIDLYPFVLKRRCIIHSEEEFFVLTRRWESNLSLISSSSYRGPSPSCLFKGHDTHKIEPYQ